MFRFIIGTKNRILEAVISYIFVEVKLCGGELEKGTKNITTYLRGIAISKNKKIIQMLYLL